MRDSWKEDALFGYQFLNGTNPVLLRRSASLPSRLVFPPGMEELKDQLEQELQVLNEARSVTGAGSTGGPAARWTAGRDLTGDIGGGHEKRSYVPSSQSETSELGGGGRRGDGDRVEMIAALAL